MLRGEDYPVRNTAIVIGAIAAVLVVVSIKQALTQSFALRAPDLVEWITPSDATAIVRRFDRDVASDAMVDRVDPVWQASAKRALRADPLSAGAMRLLALASPNADEQRMRMELAERISKRDLITQLWLIQNSVQKQDIPAALKHYDRALSVNIRMRETLFPVLANAIELEDLRRAVVPYVRANRPWVYDFVGFATYKAPSPVYVADLLLRSGGGRANPSHRPLEAQLLLALVAKGEVAVAQRYAQTMTRNWSELKNDFAINEQTLDPDLRPFSWDIGGDASLNTGYDPTEGLVVIAPPNVRGQAASRLMLLKPGRWVLTQRVSLPSLSPMANGQWALSCVTSEGAERFWDQRVPLQVGQQIYRTAFVVPEGCPAVKFEFIVRGNDAQLEARIALSDLRLSAN